VCKKERERETARSLPMSENLPWVCRDKKIAIFHLTNWSQGPKQRGIYSYRWYLAR
jgi:hypothetical protein